MEDLIEYLKIDFEVEILSPNLIFPGLFQKEGKRRQPNYFSFKPLSSLEEDGVKQYSFNPILCSLLKSPKIVLDLLTSFFVFFKNDRQSNISLLTTIVLGACNGYCLKKLSLCC